METKKIYDNIDKKLADCLSNHDFICFKQQIKRLHKMQDCNQKNEILMHVFHISIANNFIKEFKFLIKNVNLNVLFSKDNNKLTNLNRLYYKYNNLYNKDIDSVLNYILLYINDHDLKYLPFEIINFVIEQNKIKKIEQQFDTLFILCAGRYPWYIVDKFITINNCSYLLSQNVNDNVSNKKKNLIMASAYGGNISILFNLLQFNNLFWENLKCNDYYINLENIIIWKNKNKQKFLKKLLTKYPCNLEKPRIKEEIVSIILKKNPKLYLFFLQQNVGFINSISFYRYCQILIDSRSYKLLDNYLQSKKIPINSNNKQELDEEEWIGLFKDINPCDNNNHCYKNRDKLYTLYKILLKYYPYNYVKLFKTKYGMHDRVLLESLVVIPKGLYLIKKYSKYIEDWNYQNHIGWTAFLNAVRYGEYQTVRYLLDNRKIKIDTTTDICGYSEDDYYNIVNCAISNIDIRVLTDCLQEIKKRQIYIKGITAKTFFRIIESNHFLNYQERKKRFKIVYNFFQHYPKPKYKLEKKIEYIKKYALSNTRVENLSWNKWILFQFKEIEFPTQKIVEIVEFIRVNHHYTLFSNFQKNMEKKINFIQLLLDHNIKFNKKELVISLVKRFGIINNLFMEYLFKNVISLNEIVSDLQSKNKFVKKIILHLNHEVNIMPVTNPRKSPHKVKQYFLDTIKIIQNLNINLNNVTLESYSFIDYTVKNCNDYLINLFILNGINVNKISIYYKSRNYYYFKHSIIRKWLKVNYYLRLFMRRRNIKHFKQFNNNFQSVMLDLLIYPEIPNTVLSSGGPQYRESLCEFNSLINKSLSKNPVHITPFHFAHLQKSNILISEKADGVTKDHLPENIFPAIDIKLQNIKAEYIEKYNLYLVFDTCPIQAGLLNGSSHNLLAFENFQWLRSLHPETSNINYSYLFENINQEIKLERKSLKKFIEKHKNTKKPIWWPKIAWYHNYQHHKLSDSISTLDKFYLTNVFPIDGWIFTPNKKGTIAKYKPFEHLTIDVNHINGKWYSGDNQLVEIYYQNNLDYKNGIYRCYWNDLSKRWYAKEYREEKYKANNLQLIQNIWNQQKYQWNIHNFTSFPKYYQQKNLVKDKDCIQFLNYQRKIFEELFSNMPKNNILDIGCGNGSILKYIPENISSYLGIEIDPSCIWNFNRKVIKNKRKNINILWCDMGEKWNIDKQEKVINSKSITIQNKLYQSINNCKFDTVILNFSIHNCFQNLSRISNLINEINSKTTQHSEMLISIIDLDLLSEDTVYYQKLVNYKNSISNTGIKYKFPWCNTEFISEPIVSGQMLIDLMESQQWKCVEKKRFNNLSKNNIWRKYQQSLLWLKFSKK